MRPLAIKQTMKDKLSTILTNQTSGRRTFLDWIIYLKINESLQIISHQKTKTRNFTSWKFSNGEQEDGFDPEDMETKGVGSRFYRKA